MGAAGGGRADRITGTCAAGHRRSDRFVACYVLDLLAYPYAKTVLAEASRLLAPDGLLCLVSLTHGVTRTGRVVSKAFETASERWPAMVGACRPIELATLLEPSAWRIAHREVLTRWGVPSEVLVASSVRRGPDA
jgi:hypothetical protein